MNLNNKPGKAQFKALFLRKWRTEGPTKTLGALALAVVIASGRALVRAGKRAVDFRQPALPGCDPALPPAKNWKGERRPPSAWYLGGVERLLRRSCDWRTHPIWNWISGGGLKGFLGARRFWAMALRHFLDGLGRVAWTFRLATIIPLEYVTRRAAQMSTAIPDFIRFRDAGLFHRPPTPVIHRIFWSGVLPPALGGLVLIAEDIVLDRTVGLPTFLYDFSALAGAMAILFPVGVFLWCLDGLPRHLAGQKWPLEVELEKIRNSAPSSPVCRQKNKRRRARLFCPTCLNLSYFLTNPVLRQSYCNTKWLSPLRGGNM